MNILSTAPRMRCMRWMILLCLLTFIGLQAQPSAAQSNGQLNPTRLNQAETYLTEQLAATRVPGAAYAIFTRDEIHLIDGYGVANPQGDAVTPTTPFLIGSLSKSITALAVMQLAETGQLSLDAPVCDYLPWFQLADPETTRRVTVRQLLTHTSGLTWRTGLIGIGGTDRRADALQRSFAHLATAPLNRSGQFAYSNVNYMLAGAIIERVTEQPYEQVIAQQIFAPLGMTHSFTAPESAGSARAIGHRYWFGQPIAEPNLPFSRAELPSYLLFASVRDMTRYLQWHLGNTDLAERELLSPAGRDLLQRGQAATPWGDAYGFGWFDEQWDDVRVLNHYGSFAGYHANMLLIPEQGWGLVLLMNAESYIGQEQRWAIAQNTVHLLLDQPLEHPPLLSVTVMASLLIAMVNLWVIGTLLRLVRHPTHTHRARFVAAGGYATVIVGYLVLLPIAFDATLGAIWLTSPDVGWMLIIGAGLAGFGACAILGQALRALVQQRWPRLPPVTADDQVDQGAG